MRQLGCSFQRLDMAQTKNAASKQLRDRKALADSALASLRLEGLEPSAEVQELVGRFVSGEITVGELDRAIERLLSSRQVHLP